MKSKEPDDLQLKMGTKDHAFWLMIEKNAKLELESARNSVKFQEGILEYAKKRIVEEKEKFK